MIYYMDLCYVLGNDAAIQIAVSIAGSVEEFANLMNKKAEELKLQNTHFVTPHGLDENEHYTTAYELAIIADYALNIEKICQVVKTKTYSVTINNNPKTITNTNELLGYLNGVEGVKTGFTNGAGRCLVTSVDRNNFSIITVVLGADTKRIRTRDSIKLIEYIYSNYELIDLEEIIEEEFQNWSKINKNRICIYKGKKQKIDIELENYKYKIYPVKKDSVKDINIEFKELNMYFEATVYKDTSIGNLILNIGNENLMNIRIITSESIERKEIRDYFFDCIKTIV